MDTSILSQNRRNQRPDWNGIEYQPKRFNVGVDFGSTYSSATFVLLSASIEKLHANDIKKVPYVVATSHNRLNCHETPTVLRYEDLCTRWGWDAKRVEESGEDLPGQYLDMIKLLLDETQESDDVNRDNLRRHRSDIIRKLNKTVIDVLVDFLTPFFKHIMDHMTNKGYYDPRDMVELDCTVPAIWKEIPRRKMLAAIDKAGTMSGFGFGKAVWLVSEPEAASSYVLKMNTNWDLRQGQNILLCDAGGGTVDLITYTITQETPLRVQEAVAGTGDFDSTLLQYDYTNVLQQGGLCGSNHLNTRCFEQTIQRLENAKFVDGRKSQQAKFKMAMEVTNQFEKNIKTVFIGKDDVNHSATVSRLMASPEDEFRDDRIIFTPHRLNLIFDPIISQVWELMRSQLQSARDENLAVHKVCLVGGFGGSPRLRSFLIEKLDNWAVEHDQDWIDLFVPDAPDIATAYGATLRSMDKKNGAPRRCRSSLGITITEEYRKSIAGHKNAETTNDGNDAKKYVRNCLDWMIELNEILPPTDFSRKRELHRDVPEHQDIVILSVTVYSSDTNRDSHYPITHPKNHDHVQVEDVEVTLDMTKFRDKLEKIPIAKKRPRRRKQALKCAQNQGLSEPLRKSGRKRVPTVKALNFQGSSEDATPGIEQLEENPTTQVVTLDLSTLNISSPQDSPGISQTQQQPTSASEPDDQEASCSFPGNNDATVEYYYRVYYQFVIEVDGLIINYRMDIPVAGECIEGRINLAQILPPGSS